MPVVLTIAGLDPSGGAGVIADVEAILAFGCAPAVTITAITFQNDRAVSGVEPLASETIRRQVRAVAEQGAIDAVKIGMLPTVDAVSEVVKLCHSGHLPPPIVDPVMRSTSGYPLIAEPAIPLFISNLLPLARLVTPNVPEAEQLTGLRIVDIEGMQAAAGAIRKLGAKAVLIKGGHLEQSEQSNRQEAVDLLDDNGQIHVFRSAWIANAQLRGTGCRLSSAIAALTAKGKPLEESITDAKQFVNNLLKKASASRSTNR
jgi:hydroxymethylpyrimidine kinase/phosphomethylpyrimidine kinase